MANLESTAINNLVAMMASRPLAADEPEDDELLAQTPPPRSARLPGVGAAPLPRVGAVLPVRPSEELTYVRDLPQLAGAAAVRAHEIGPDAGRWPRGASVGSIGALAPAARHALPPPAGSHALPLGRHALPVGRHALPLPAGPHARPLSDDTGLNTLRVRRTAPAKRQALLVAAIVVGGCAVGTIAARTTRHPAPRAAASPIVAPLPTPPRTAVAATAPAPVPAPAAATAPAPAASASRVQVRLDSVPPGASLTLVDDGHPAPVGTTPLDVTLDPSHAYDVVFALAGHPARVVHVDPRTAQHVSLTFDDAPAAPTAVAAVAATAADDPTAPTATPRRAAREVQPEHHAHSHAHAHGLLMISSKPPCEIVIDGRRTGLVTPQRALALSPGAHAITLVNAEQRVRHTEHVRITAHHATKLVRDLMRRG